MAGGGSVVLGQDQDEVGGGTDRGQSFNGLVADAWLGQELLTESQMQEYIQCRVVLPSSSQALLDFQDLINDFTFGVATAVTSEEVTEWGQTND